MDGARPARWLWRASWLMLTGVLAISVGGAVLLGLGMTDPPRAGPLIWRDSTVQHWTFATTDLQFRDVPFSLPAAPYTLEIAARFSGGSPAGARWTVGLYPSHALFTPARDNFTVYNNGYYEVGLDASGPLGFPHLKANGQFNLLRLDVRADSTATLRLNDEVAWQGTLAGLDRSKDPTVLADPSGWALILSAGGANHGAILTWEQIAVYAPPGS